MLVHLARRVAAAAPALGVALVLLFCFLQVVPGDPFSREPASGLSRDTGAVRRALGADRPPDERFLSWAAGLATGDMGRSWSLRRPVAEAIGEAAGNTVLLMAAAIAAQFALGIGAGALAAGVRGGRLDRVLGGGFTVAYSLPSYWTGLILMVVFSVRLGWLPVSQMHSPGSDDLPALWRLWDAALHMALPVVSLALPGAAGIALLVREEIGDALTGRFALAARARGASRRRTVALHALRGALRPVAGLLGLALPGLAGGSVVVESLFAWPGMGRLAYQAALARDEPLILGCAAATALLVVAGGLAADLAVAVLDPRVREGDG
ncbi:MAG TPA: ABC transporter permease [Candidatus Polarisedimenticolia bacterium]|nr:ABC transporter permease [Candidatus Polarisedimenticolia bacterium]